MFKVRGGQIIKLLAPRLLVPMAIKISDDKGGCKKSPKHYQESEQLLPWGQIYHLTLLTTFLRSRITLRVSRTSLQSTKPATTMAAKTTKSTNVMLPSQNCKLFSFVIPDLPWRQTGAGMTMTANTLQIWKERWRGTQQAARAAAFPPKLFFPIQARHAPEGQQPDGASWQNQYDRPGDPETADE